MKPLNHPREYFPHLASDLCGLPMESSPRSDPPSGRGSGRFRRPSERLSVGLSTVSSSTFRWSSGQGLRPSRAYRRLWDSPPSVSRAVCLGGFPSAARRPAASLPVVDRNLFFLCLPSPEQQSCSLRVSSIQVLSASNTLKAAGNEFILHTLI